MAEKQHYIIYNYSMLLATLLLCRHCLLAHGVSNVVGARPLEYTLLENSAAGIILGDVINDASITSSSSKKATARLLPSGTHVKYFALDGSTLKTSDVKLNRDAICANQENCTIKLDILLLRGLEQRFVKVSKVGLYLYWTKFNIT